MNPINQYVANDFNLRILSQVNEELPMRCDGFVNRIGIPADLKCELENGTIHTFKSVPAGGFIFCRIQKIYETGTTLARVEKLFIE